MKFFAVILGSLLALSSPAATVNAYATQSGISISIGEYFVNDDGSTTVYKDYESVYSNQTIHKVTYVENTGEACYIRATTESNDWEDYYTLLYSDDWVLKDDGYAYYTKLVDTDTAVNVIEGITFSENLESESLARNDCTLKISMTVEAISEEIEPDFTQDSPWWYYAYGENLLGALEISLPTQSAVVSVSKDIVSTGASANVTYVILAVLVLFVLLAFIAYKIYRKKHSKTCLSDKQVQGENL